MIEREPEPQSGEDRLIARYFRPLAVHPGAHALIDDAATFTPPAGADIVLTTDALVGGDWYGTDGRAQVSIEEGLAKTINVKLGDTLRFDVAGMQVEGPVTSLRKVDWNSFKVNFFVLMPPPSISDLPATFITSFHLPPGQQGLIDGLINKYPNVTAIDVAPILAQIQRVLEQVIGAVQFLFIFTLAAGVLASLWRPAMARVPMTRRSSYTHPARPRTPRRCHLRTRRLSRTASTSASGKVLRPRIACSCRRHSSGRTARPTPCSPRSGTVPRWCCRDASKRARRLT